MSQRRVQAVWGTILLTPGVGLILVFIALPILVTAWISLHHWSMFTPITRMDWAGLDNYGEVIFDPTFQQALINTFSYAALNIVITLPLALAVGIFLYRTRLRGRTVARSILFSTYMIPTIAVSIIWGYLYSPLYGPFNQILSWLGIPAQGWLGSVGQAMLSLVFFNVWQTLGYYTVLVIAGLTQIPQDYYDSSSIDGAGTLAQTRYITIPLLRRTLVFVVVIAAINTLQVFDPVYALTQGGPSTATNVLAYHIYHNAFDFGRAGLASAMAMLLLVALGVVVSFFLRAVRGT